ncbi:hypothetical protein, partial [Klebsiella pneumoniae]|uniref:hypothetical protein n=1 Tax=Klebsiella pneumoniae TaxID=573 RepID=UPI003719B5C3
MAWVVNGELMAKMSQTALNSLLTIQAANSAHLERAWRPAEGEADHADHRYSSTDGPAHPDAVASGTPAGAG